MRLIFPFLFLLGVLAISCKKTESLSYLPLTEYFPLKAGKTFTYRMDSTLTTPFGSGFVTKHFLAKDSVESQFTDVHGRPSFRIWRFIRDTLQTQPWTYSSTIIATIDHKNEWIEYVENNLRFIKLRQPLSEGFSWSGNSFIDTKGANTAVRFMDEWDYTYQDLHQPFTVRKGTFDSTITVLQADEVDPPGPFDPQFYQQSIYSVEVYAKGVGMIYKELMYKTWQTVPRGYWTDDSYGIKLSLIDYK